MAAKKRKLKRNISKESVIEKLQKDREEKKPKLKKDGTPKKSGGYRANAGRPPGLQSKKLAQTVMSFRERYPIQPLDHFMSILNNDKEPKSRRDYAAEKALPFLNQRLSAVQLTGENGGPVRYAIDVTKLSDEELSFLERVMTKAAAPMAENDNDEPTEGDEDDDAAIREVAG